MLILCVFKNHVCSLCCLIFQFVCFFFSFQLFVLLRRRNLKSSSHFTSFKRDPMGLSLRSLDPLNRIDIALYSCTTDLRIESCENLK